MNRRGFLVAGAAAAGGSAAALTWSAAPPADHGSLSGQTGAAWFTNVALRTHDGRTVRFYDDLLRGKIVLINFIFMACGDICPSMTQNLVSVQERLGSRLGRDIFMYSISLDPEHDTPEMLKAYAEALGVGPGWLFLTGSPADIELLRHRLGFVWSDPLRDADRTQHIGVVRIGNEPLHRWTMCPGLANPAAIVRSVRRVIPGATWDAA